MANPNLSESASAMSRGYWDRLSESERKAATAGARAAAQRAAAQRRVDRAIEKLVSEAPPLTNHQAARLRALLADQSATGAA